MRETKRRNPVQLRYGGEPAPTAPGKRTRVEARYGTTTGARAGAKAPVQLAKGSGDAPAHRGRLQIQGGGLEVSWPWADGAPPAAAAAVAGLDGLWNGLGKTEKSTRDQAYEKARKYIQRVAPEGVDGPFSKTFQNRGLGRNEGDHRVDIEVKMGKAFVG